MKVLMIVVVVVGALMTLWLVRSGRGKSSKAVRATASANKGRARKPFRASSIRCDETACEASKSLSGKRFLDVDRNIPGLPLDSCDVDQCQCSYAHHDDRRSNHEDRRHPNALQADLYTHAGNQERRNVKRSVRRKTDLA